MNQKQEELQMAKKNFENPKKKENKNRSKTDLPDIKTKVETTQQGASMKKTLGGK